MGTKWPPDVPDTGPGPRCARCGEHVSQGYHRQWSNNDGVLTSCRHCAPRSYRFGEDIYGRNLDDIEFRGSDPSDRGTDPAPSSRVVDSMSLGPDPLEDYDDFRASSPAALLDD